MEFFRRLFTSIWKIWFFVWFLIIMLIFLSPFLILLTKKKWYPLVYKTETIVCFLIMLMSGIFLKKIFLTDKNKLPKPAIYVANHTSYLDILASYVVIPNYTIFMGKAELRKVPFINLFFRGMNVLVNRKSKMDSHRAFIEIGTRLDEGTSVYIFPEGTIGENGELLKFKNGAFKLAIAKQIPIVPIIYTNNWRLLQNGGFLKSFGRPGITEAIIHPPIITKGMTDENLVALREQVYHIFEDTIIRYDTNRITKKK